MFQENTDYSQDPIGLATLINELSEDAKQAFLRLLDPEYSGGPGSTRRLLNLVTNWGDEEQKSFHKLLEHRRNSERRDFFRKKCSFMVGFLTENGLKHDFVKNIGTGGAFVETMESFFAGQKFLMILQSENDEEPFLVLSEVRWTNHEGVGVRFLMENDGQEDRLRLLIGDLD